MTYDIHIYTPQWQWGSCCTQYLYFHICTVRSICMNRVPIGLQTLRRLPPHHPCVFAHTSCVHAVVLAIVWDGILLIKHFRKQSSFPVHSLNILTRLLVSFPPPKIFYDGQKIINTSTKRHSIRKMCYLFSSNARRVILFVAFITLASCWPSVRPCINEQPK